MQLGHEDIKAIAAAMAPAVADVVAQRVLELVNERPRNRLVDAAELARVLGVDREWVYEHSERLEAIRLGKGPRPRLRFEIGRAVESFARLSAQPRLPRWMALGARRSRVRGGHGEGVADRTSTPLSTAVGAG
jgi:hypothetical protein